MKEVKHAISWVTLKLTTQVQKITTEDSKSVFFNPKDVSISIEDYITRIAKYSSYVSDDNCNHSRLCKTTSWSSHSCRECQFGACTQCGQNDIKQMLILSYLLLQRYIGKNSSNVLTSRTIHRLFLICVVITNKYNFDIICNNLQFSKIGGIPLLELNVMEIEFLRIMNFDLAILLNDYEQIEIEIRHFENRQYSKSLPILIPRKDKRKYRMKPNHLFKNPDSYVNFTIPTITVKLPLIHNHNMLNSSDIERLQFRMSF
jgi:hypothetical protein